MTNKRVRPRSFVLSLRVTKSPPVGRHERDPFGETLPNLHLPKQYDSVAKSHTDAKSVPVCTLLYWLPQMIKNETGRLVQLLKRFQGGQAASLDPVTAAASSATVNDSNPDSSLTAHAISDRRVERLASCCDQEHVPRPIADDALLMDLYRVQRVFPVKPTPVLVPRDSGLPLRCEQTLFEGEWITCFVIGGEKRLCLTQFMHSRSLRRFTFSDINKTCAYLNIHCPPCSREQMEALKVRLNESVVFPSP
ncbi:SKI/SNO/DAC family protein [Trichuris suis]|nr:SKI/SNO/DAC family protein [Trichuris suis]